MRFTRFVRRIILLAALPLLLLAIPAASVATASAATGTGWIRLAHLSPNTPAVDVYLYSFGDSSAQIVLHHVAYGTVSPYEQLPAGDYTFTVLSASAQYRLYIRGQQSNFIIPAVTAEDATSQHAQLNLVNIADVYAVQAFDAPELGLIFTYWTPTQKHMSSKEARQKAVPQAAPASQATENRTSIAVYTAGR